MRRIADPALLESYLWDESKIIKGKANEVELPRTEGEVSEILKEMNDKNIRVTISGAGTGISGSRVPTEGVVLSIEELTKVAREPKKGEELVLFNENGKNYSMIIGMEGQQYYAILPPAISIKSLGDVLDGKGLFYPPDPTETNAFLGGTVSTNASGARSFFYGPTRNFVRRLRVVLPEGDVIDVRRGEVFAERGRFTIIMTTAETREIEIPRYSMPHVEKNSAGYYVKPVMDLVDLFIGSEGTLGVITEIEVSLLPKPKVIVPIFAHFKGEDDSIGFFKRLRSLSKSGELNVLSIEFFDSRSVNFLRMNDPSSKIPQGSESIVDFELEVSVSEEQNSALEKVSKVLTECNMLDALVLSEDNAKEIRHSLPENINKFIRSKGTKKVATDAAVPEDQFDEMWNIYHEIAEETGVNYVIFGHIGNFHLHFNFLPVDEDEVSRAQVAIGSILKKAVELGGTVTAEHGVGKKYYIENGQKRHLIRIMYSYENLLQMAKLKKRMDPKLILNIGNIIPEEILVALDAEFP
jgi:D-lactate dehydrogenase (cytochrome)